MWPDWWNLNWSARLIITVNTPGLTATHTNVPILVTLPAGTLQPAAAVDGRDLRFVDAASGTLLPHELEVFDQNSTSEIWVRVPALDGVTPQRVIHLYWGNSTAGDAQDAPSVWTNNFLAVWHLNGDTTQQLDSTATAAHGTPFNMGAADSTAVIGPGLAFDGTNDIVSVGTGTTPASLNVVGNLTISGWVNSAYEGTVVGKRNYGQPQWHLITVQDGGLYAGYLRYGSNSGDACWWRNTTVLTAGYHHLAVVVDTNGDPLRFVVDGREETPVLRGSCFGPNTTVDVPVSLGARWSGTQTGGRLTGTLDEVRVEAGQRPAEWITLQYRSMTRQLCTLGMVQLR